MNALSVPQTSREPPPLPAQR